MLLCGPIDTVQPGNSQLCPAAGSRLAHLRHRQGHRGIGAGTLLRAEAAAELWGRWWACWVW